MALQNLPRKTSTSCKLWLVTGWTTVPRKRPSLTLTSLVILSWKSGNRWYPYWFRDSWKSRCFVRICVQVNSRRPTNSSRNILDIRLVLVDHVMSVLTDYLKSSKVYWHFRSILIESTKSPSDINPNNNGFFSESSRNWLWLWEGAFPKAPKGNSMFRDLRNTRHIIAKDRARGRWEAQSPRSSQWWVSRSHATTARRSTRDWSKNNFSDCRQTGCEGSDCSFGRRRRNFSLRSFRCIRYIGVSSSFT